jgi:hypothetical protein
LAGNRKWNAAVKSFAASATVAVGFTGTLFTVHVDSVANVCSALWMDEELQHGEFWGKENALGIACSKERGVYRPSDAVVHSEASKRPSNPRWKQVSYQKKNFAFPPCTTVVVKAICDCLDISEADATRFHSLKEEVEKRKCLENIFRKGASSKLIVLVDAIHELFKDGRYKILLSVCYLDTLLIVREYLLLRFFLDKTVSIFEFSGNFHPTLRTASLTTFMTCSNGPDTKAILIVTVAAAKNGLNITNGLDSPTAQVEFEYSDSATDRFQLQCRIDRDGNPHSVQLVVIAGQDTINECKLERHVAQYQKRKRAGDDVGDKFLET